MMDITVKPTIQYADNSFQINPPLPEGTTREQAQKVFNVPGERYSCAAWNGHEFEVVTMRIDESLSEVTLEGRTDAPVNRLHEATMLVYYPLDDRTKLIDWKSATKAKLNEDKTAWIPEHATAGNHHDIGLSFEDGVFTVFRHEIDSLDAELKRLDPRDNPYARKLREYTSLIQLQSKTLEKVVEADAAKYLGYYEQHPSPIVGHVMGAVKDGLAAVKAESTALWRTGGSAITRVESAVNKRASRTVETRWDQEARIAKEKAAKAAAENEQD